MARWWFFGKIGTPSFHCGSQGKFNYQQKRDLVNVKLKWVKDRTLDATVAGARDVRAVCMLVSLISSKPNDCQPIYNLSRHRRQLDLPNVLKLSTFIRKYPSIFSESHILDSGGTRVPSFSLTPEAIDLHHEELNVLQQNQNEILERLCKLLMLTENTILPLHTIDQLKWDMGFPYDYQSSMIPNYPRLFSLIHLPHDRIALKLLAWDDRLAVSYLQKNSLSHNEENSEFPIGFTRGFGLKRKCTQWLKEWQTLPYTCPYSDASHLDPRTDISEKRIVGVFHELLHLTIHKRTERKNVSNLRKPLGLPQKFTKVFERHPGIFYISKKGDTQTVVLREAYDGHQVIQKHPLLGIRERFASLMEKGLLARSRGLYKKHVDVSGEELLDSGQQVGDLDNEFHSRYDSDQMDELMRNPY